MSAAIDILGPITGKPIEEPIISESIVDDRLIVGVDLGQSQDHTAIVIFDRLERVIRRSQMFGFEPTPRLSETRKPIYIARHIDRLPLGTSYPDIVRHVTDLIRELPRRPRAPDLVVDGTGVGKAVVDLFREARMNPIAISITAGREVHSPSSRVFNVPKRDLVAVLSVLLQERRIRISRSLKHSQTLVEEMLNFKVKVSASGHDSYEAWREAIHDDLVLAMAIAAWWGERGLQKAFFTNMRIFER